MKGALLAVFVLAVTACGGTSTKAAAPCLSKLGLYTNEGISRDLHILGFDVRSIAPPPTVKRVADLSFRSPGRGANDAQFFSFASDRDARAFAHTWARGRSRVRVETVVLLWPRPPSARNGRALTAGNTVVFFTTKPTPRQRRAVVGCLD